MKANFKILFSSFAMFVLMFSFAVAEEGTSNSSTNVSVESDSDDSNAVTANGRIMTKAEVEAEREAYKAKQEELREAKKKIIEEFKESKIKIREDRIEIRKKLMEGGEYRFRIEGKNITARQLSEDERELIVDRINLRTGLNLSVEDLDNKTTLRAYLSNGRFANVKILPASASARAQEVMKLKCAERNCTFELKEVSDEGRVKVAYEVKTDKDSRMFFLFKKTVPVVAEVDAETGEIIQVRRPWWAFLANEKDDDVDADEVEAEIEAETESEVEVEDNGTSSGDASGTVEAGSGENVDAADNIVDVDANVGVNANIGL